MNEIDIAYKAVQERNAAEAERDALRAKIKQLSVDAARLCSRGNRLERENANLQAMCDELAKELAAMCTDDCMQPTTYKDCFISCSVKDVLFKYGAMKSTSGNGGDNG